MIYRVEDNWGGVAFAKSHYGEKPDGSLLLIRCGGGTMRPRPDNVTITEIEEGSVVKEFPVGTRCVIAKYGSDYNGTVVRQGTKRVDVEIRLMNGNDRVVKSIPANECRLPQKGLV